MTQTLENAYAVIIGVDENQIDQLALPTVAKDVQALYDVLIDPQRCGYRAEHVQLCCGAEATKDSIFNALYWLQDKIKDDPDATVVIYYSGHGVFDGLANRYYLLPYDLGEMRRMRQRAISADELGAEIAVLQPQRMLIILDCCHAAGLDVKGATASQPNLSPSAFPLDLPETVNIPTFQEGAKDARLLADGYGRAILNSSTGLESSYIRRDGAMSIFTYHLIEALTGHAPHAEDDKTVLVTDVMSYVTRKVAETARDEGRQQTPVMKTTGVFPIALLLGGRGTKGIGTLPVPQTPPPNPTMPFNQQGQTVYGNQVNIGHDAHIGQIGDVINTSGGDYVRGNKHVVQGVSEADLQRLFAPLIQAVMRVLVSAEDKQGALDKIQTLQTEVGKGEQADAARIMLLTQDVAASAPRAILSKELFSQCTMALEDAFDVDSFAAMLRGRVGKRLDLITSTRVGFSTIVNNVLLQAEYEGWTDALIKGAVTHNPLNKRLGAFYATYSNAGTA